MCYIAPSCIIYHIPSTHRDSWLIVLLHLSNMWKNWTRKLCFNSQLYIPCYFSFPDVMNFIFLHWDRVLLLALFVLEAAIWPRMSFNPWYSYPNLLVLELQVGATPHSKVLPLWLFLFLSSSSSSSSLPLALPPPALPLLFSCSFSFSLPPALPSSLLLLLFLLFSLLLNRSCLGYFYILLRWTCLWQILLAFIYLKMSWFPFHFWILLSLMKFCVAIFFQLLENIFCDLLCSWWDIYWFLSFFPLCG